MKKLTVVRYSYTYSRHVATYLLLLFSTVSNYFQYIEKLSISTSKISAQNANKFFYHTQTKT